MKTPQPHGVTLKSKNLPSKQAKKPAEKKSFSDQVHAIKIQEAERLREHRAKLQKEKYDAIEEELMLSMYGPPRNHAAE